MALRTFHPCAFGFHTTNIRRVGTSTDGGRSLSGYQDIVESDGGGFLQADFTDGSTRTRAQGGAWRALGDYLGGGGQAIDVLLCSERLFQPVGSKQRVTHSDGSPFSDASLYTSDGAAFRVGGDAPLRATTIALVGTSELALIGGELFSIEHPAWGWRAYRINGFNSDGTVAFFPPLREAVTAGTPAELDTPRCRMRLAAATDNATTNGRYTKCAMSFVEDMRPPA